VEFSSVLQRPCFVGRKLAFRASGTALQQQQQRQHQQNEAIKLMSMMEIPLLQQLPQPPALSYTAPSACTHTEHAAAAALCLSRSDIEQLDPRLVLLLHLSDGVIPHASHFISKNLVPLENGSFEDVMATSSGHSAHAHAEPGDAAIIHHAHEHVGLSEERIRSSTDTQHTFHTQEAAAAKKTKNLLSQKHISVARKLQTAVATQRQKVTMSHGLAWGERVSLHQFHHEKLMSVPFAAAVVHTGRVIACFVIGGNLCSVDCLGWMKWY
jgi:hypothetical protein